MEDIIQNNTSIEIPGVEVKTGMALYDGNTEIYLAVMRFFLPNAIKVIEKLRNVSEEALQEYAINVHGLKGICAGIGAEKVRKAAYDLEKMATSGNFSGVLAGNGALLIETENLVSDIQAWLKKYDSQNAKPILPCPDPYLLNSLRKHCEAYNMKGIDEVMEDLEKASYETDASLMVWLREKIDESDFSSVAERLSKYDQE